MSYSNEHPAKNKSYKKPFGLSFVLHVAIILMLVFSLNWSHQPAVLQVGNDKTEVIEAVSMDGDQIAKEAARIKQDNSEKKKVEEIQENKLKEAEKEAEEAIKQEEVKKEEQKQQETKKLEQLQKQEEAEKQKEVIEKEQAIQEKQLQEKKRLEEEQKVIEEKKIIEEKAVLKAQADAKAKIDAKVKADAVAKAKALADAKAKADAKLKADAKAKADAKTKADAIAKAKAAATAKAKAAADAKAKAATAAKAKADATAKANAAAVKAKQDTDARRAQVSHMQGEVNRYKVLITQAIKNKWIVPSNVQAGLFSQFEIRLAPGGAVLSVKLLRSSGDSVLDRSAENAIYKASPLPVPTDPGMFEMFRLINLKVTPDANVAAVIN